MPSPSGRTWRSDIALMLSDKWFVYWDSFNFFFGCPLCWGIFLSIPSFAHKKIAGTHLFFDFVTMHVKWLHRFTAIVNLTKDATIERWGGVGGCDWPKHKCFAKTKLKIHVRQLRSITCLIICLWALSKMFCTFVVPVQNPMAHSFSFALGSSILNECESQIILRPPFLNAWKCGKVKNVGRVAHGRPTLLTIAKGGRSSWRTMHEWCLGSNMSSTKHVGDLKMSSYVCWITSGGVKLVHIHKNWWIHEPTEVESTYIGSPIQALICCHPTKIVGLISFNGGTFSKKYAHGCICDCYKCCTTRINSQNKPNMGSKNLQPIPAYERPWHDHLKMTN